MTPEELSLLVKVPVSSLVNEPNPLDAKVLIYNGGGQLKTTPLEEIKNEVASGIIGEAVPSTVPTPWTSGDPNLYEKYDVKTAGTYTNFKDASNASIVVSSGDLQSNYVQLWVTNGVAQKVLKAIPSAQVSPVYDETTKINAQGGFQISAYNGFVDSKNGFRATGNLFKAVSSKSGFYLDLSGNEQVNAAVAYSDFIKIKPSTKYTQNVTQIRNFYNKYKEHIIGVAPDTNTWESPANAEYVILDVLTAYLPTFSLVEGTTISSATDFSLPTIEGVLSPVWNVIQHSSTAYNSIRTLGEKLMLESNYYNRYEIQLAEGTYTESDIKGFGKYVRVKGYNRDNCIIRFNGTSSEILPSDYSYPTEAGKVANVVAKGLKHVVFISRDILFENVTFDAISCKYPIHADNNGYKKAVFKNCWIKESDCLYPIGIGMWSGQELIFDKCIIERAHFYIAMRAFFYHNTFNQKLGSKVEFLNCSMIQCGGAAVYENGSNNEDILNITNCVSDSIFEIEYGVSQDADGKTFWTSPTSGIKEPNPANIPYNIKLNTIGTSVDLIYSSPNFSGYTSARPLFYKHIISDYIGLAKALEVLVRGDVVSPYGDAPHTTTNRVKAYNTAVLSLPPIGVALHDAALNEMVYFSKTGKVSYIKCNGTGISNFNGNTKKLIFNETTKVFDSNVNASYKVADAIALDKDPVAGLLAATLRMK